MDRMTRFSWLALGLAFSAAAAAVNYSKSDDPENLALFERAKQAAAYDLKDPGSAQFRNLHLSTGLPGDACGEINAKNSYGAYVGYVLFRYDDDKKEAVILDPSSDYYEVDLSLYELVCGKDSGKPAPTP